MGGDLILASWVLVSGCSLELRADGIQVGAHCELSQPGEKGLLFTDRYRPGTSQDPRIETLSLGDLSGL